MPRRPPLPAPPSPLPPTLACVCLPHFALQVLGRRDPACLAFPAVVVTEDRPQGVVREANRLARAGRVLPGMRYAAALGLCADLRAGVVEPGDEQAVMDEVAERLRRCSPLVESGGRSAGQGAAEPGVFWLDVTGLWSLWPDPQAWAETVRSEVQAAGFKSSVVVGFSRFAVYAIARQSQGVVVVSDPQAEARLRDRVHLASLGPALGLPPAVRDALYMLGIQTLGQLLALPELDLRERHGDAAWTLHRRARDGLVEPLRAVLPEAPLQRHRDIDPPDDQRDRLLFIAKGLLAELLKAAAQAHRSLAVLHLRLELEEPHRNRQIAQAAPKGGERLVQSAVQTSEPSLWEPQWLELLRLRLDALHLPARAERLVLSAETQPATAHQLQMWQLLAEAGGLARRDPQAGREALARITAALGEQAVVRAELQSAHLPEARFRWLPAGAAMATKALTPPRDPQLVRRIASKPVQLPSRPKHEPDGWLLADWRQGAVSRLWGPYRVTGGWWSREVRRDYWFVETERGDLLWVFYDGVRRLWYWQGRVE